MVQTKSDREASEMDETDTLSVSGKALLSGIYEPMWEMGVLGLRQERTERSTKEQ